jgi:hypothetical protein
MKIEIACMPRNKVIRRYNRRILVTMTFYVLFLLGASYFLRHYHPGRTITILLSILPSLPILGVIVTVGLYLKEETDEFVRNVFLQGMLWTMGLLLAFCSVWGFLEMFADFPHIPTFYTFPAFWFLFGVCYPLVRRQYRSGPDE